MFGPLYTSDTSVTDTALSMISPTFSKIHTPHDMLPTISSLVSDDEHILHPSTAQDPNTSMPSYTKQPINTPSLKTTRECYPNQNTITCKTPSPGQRRRRYATSHQH